MSTDTTSLVTNYYETILNRTPSADEVTAWSNLIDGGILAANDVLADIVNSPEAQQNVVPVVELYQAAFGRVPDQAGLQAWVGADESQGLSLQQTAQDFLSSAEGQAIYGSGTDITVQFLSALYKNVFNRDADTAGLNAWLSQNGALSRADVLVDFVTSAEGQADLNPLANQFLTAAGQDLPTAYDGSLYANASGSTVTLTTGVDKLNLTGNNNVVSGTANGGIFTGAATYNPGDQIIGDANSTGNQLDILDLSTGGVWNPTNLPGVVVSNVQTVDMNSQEAVNINTATGLDGYGGLTDLIVNYSDVSVGPFGRTVNNDSTISAAGTTAVSAEDFSTGRNSDSILGGSDINFIADGVTTGGAINVGSATAAPTGVITVTANDANTKGSHTGSRITTTGGTAVNITQNIQAPTGTTTTHTATGGTITVNGTTLTTAVTVNQTAPVTPVAGVVGVTETAAITFAATGLAAGQSLTIAGLTFTAGSNGASQAEVEAAFANLAVGTSGSSLTSANGTFSGTLTGWSTGALNSGTNTIVATSNVPNQNVTDLAYIDDRKALAGAPVELQGQAPVTETALITFAAGLQAGQSLTIGGLTFTALLGGATAAQVAAAFAGLTAGTTALQANLTHATIHGAFTGGTLTEWSTGSLDPTTNAITATSSIPNTDVSDLPVTDSHNALAGPPAETQGFAGVTETATITFANGLVAGQALTIAGLTFTAGISGATQAQVEAAFANLAVGKTAAQANAANNPAGGTFTAGTLTGWSTGSLDPTTNAITATSSTPTTDVPDLPVTDFSNALAGTPDETSGAPSVNYVGGIADGAVTVNDVNANSTTKAGTITDVSLSNYSSGATINDNALANLTLAGIGHGVTIRDSLSSPTATTLALNLNGLTDNIGLTDTNGEIQTLNITTDGAIASTLGAILDIGLKTLDVSGTQALTLGGAMPASLTDVEVTGGVGLTVALGPNTAFSSDSTGTDVITISAPATKTIKGNGSANEELVWNGAAAPASTAALGNASGFNVLGIGSNVASGGNQTFDMSKITGFSEFDVQANNTTNTITLNNVTAGTPLAIDGTFAGTLAYETADADGGTDSLAVTLGTATNELGFTVSGLLVGDNTTTDGIGKLSITSNASTVGASNTITALTNPGLSTLTVDGTGGLTITNGLSTSATSLDIEASGQTGTAGIIIGGVITASALTSLNIDSINAVALGGLDTAATTLTLSNSGSSTLALTALVAPHLTSLTLNNNVGITGFSDTVTTGVAVDGGSDNSAVSMTLTGAAATKTDSITLGNGNNSVTDTSAAGSTTVMVGTGNNTIVEGDGTNTITAGSGVNTITVGDGKNTITVGDGNDTITVGNGSNTITVGNGTDNITVGAGLNSITVGAGTDTLSFLAPGSTGLVFSTVSGAQANDKIALPNGGTSGAFDATQVTLSGTAAFSDYLNAAALASNAGGGAEAWFQSGGNTYVVANEDGASAFTAGTDYVVGLSGLHNLDNSTLASGTLTLGSHFG